MSFYSLLEASNHHECTLVAHSQHGIKAYFAVLELWSLMPDVVPQVEYRVARMCLNPNDTDIDNSLPTQGAQWTVWREVGLPILDKIFGSGLSPLHVRLLHKLHFLPSTLIAPLIQQVGMYDVQSACSLVVTHFKSNHSLHLLDLANELINMTTLDQQHSLSIFFIFHLRQDSSPINHLLTMANVPMLWALHTCCPQFECK